MRLSLPMLTCDRGSGPLHETVTLIPSHDDFLGLFDLVGERVGLVGSGPSLDGHLLLLLGLLLNEGPPVAFSDIVLHNRWMGSFRLLKVLTKLLKLYLFEAGVGGAAMIDSAMVTRADDW